MAAEVLTLTVGVRCSAPAPVGVKYSLKLPQHLAPTWERRPKLAPTSDRIPGVAPLEDFMHAPKWKRGAGETDATLREIRRKASKIAPAYNKGALQYLPDE